MRNAILFCGNIISNAFSALVGAGVLSNMQGVLGHAAWRWLFWSKSTNHHHHHHHTAPKTNKNIFIIIGVRGADQFNKNTVEGAATMFVAITAAVILPDLPHNSRGFTEEELQVAQLRMLEDVGEADVDAEGQGVFDGLFMAVKDIKIYLMMLTFTAYVVGLSFNAFFVRAPFFFSFLFFLFCHDKFVKLTIMG